MLRWYGYNVRRFVADGADSGIPQRRKRLFLICWIGSDCIRVKPDRINAPRLGTALAGVETVEDHDPTELPIGSRSRRIAEQIAAGAKLSNVRISAATVHTWEVPDVFGRVTAFEKDVLIAIVRLRRRARRRDFGDADPVSPGQVDEYMRCRTGATLASLVDAGYLRWKPPYIDLAHTYNGKFRRLCWNALSPTVDTHFGDPTLFLHPTEHRGLTPREAARIQGFPDEFRLLGGRRDRFRLIGNAVPPPMAARIARYVRSALL
jgi:DNA (cytosine-5)-methyltransferase 1